VPSGVVGSKELLECKGGWSLKKTRGWVGGYGLAVGRQDPVVVVVVVQLKALGRGKESLLFYHSFAAIDNKASRSVCDPPGILLILLLRHIFLDDDDDGIDKLMIMDCDDYITHRLGRRGGLVG